jgi:hypothetical protein
MLGVAQFIATLSCTVFAGAAIYVSLVEHPARMQCDTRTAATVWAPSYLRATRETYCWHARAPSGHRKLNFTSVALSVAENSLTGTDTRPNDSDRDAIERAAMVPSLQRLVSSATRCMSCASWSDVSAGSARARRYRLRAYHRSPACRRDIRGVQQNEGPRKSFMLYAARSRNGDSSGGYSLPARYVPLAIHPPRRE